MKLMIRILILCVLVVAFACALTLFIKNYLNTPRVRVAEETQLESVDPETVNTRFVQVVNESRSVVSVVDVSSSCGCIIPITRQLIVAANDVGHLELSIVPGRRLEVSADLLIEYVDRSGSTGILSTRVFAETNWEFDIEPARLVFWENIGTSEQAEFRIRSRTGGRVEVKGIACENSAISFEVLEAAPLTRIKASLDRAKSSSPVESVISLSLKSDNIESKRSLRVAIPE